MLPSRPVPLEVAVVSMGALAAALWLGAGLVRALGARTDREETIARLAEGETADAPAGTRFAARDLLVDANLKLVTRYLSTEDDVEPAVLADAVEALVDSSAADRTDVKEALAGLRRRLREQEDEMGYLPMDLEVVKELIEAAGTAGDGGEEDR